MIADYDASLDRLIADIGAARDHVHILTYILGEDATARRIAEVLKLAVKRGVKCRLMADAVGSRVGLRPHDHADYYGAYVRDPDGNKLCVVCHEAPPAGGA